VSTTQSQPGPTTATPALVVKGAAAALDFYRLAFGAVELYRLIDPHRGIVGHAEFTVGGARIMLADEFPEYGAIAPDRPGASGVTIQLDTPDVDGFVARAAAAGATVLRAPTDEFYGERAARLADPFGHVWQIATTIERISPEEMQRRYNAFYQ
jgi:uncharacterized glyoxalase superfamily protein PhnB